MDKNELSESIEDGIRNGFWKPILHIMVVISVILLIIMALSMYSSYRQDECVKNGECPQIVMASSIPEGTITCDVIVGNNTENKVVYNYDVKGYQEANAKLEQLKPFIGNINGSFKVLGDNIQESNRDWILKGIKCSD